MGIKRSGTNGGVTPWNSGRPPRGYGSSGFNPEDVTADSPRVIWWLCGHCAHEWQAAIRDRVANPACPSCGKEPKAAPKMVGEVLS